MAALVAAGRPVPPSRQRAGIPRDLEQICLTCLRTDPADRYPSATAVAEDLQRFLAGEPVKARPVGPVRKAWRIVRRRRGLVAALLLTSLAAVGIWEFRSRHTEGVRESGRNLATAGGLTSGIDLALRVVERYFGRETARRTAEYMEYQGKGWLPPTG